MMNEQTKNTERPNDIRVSVVTPAYNEAERGFINETLRSVSSQDYYDIEHIIVNDGSTDGTKDLVESFSHNHDLYLVNQDNKGQTKAVNRGIRESEGDIVIWINADDVFPRVDTISRVVEAFENNPSADIIYGDHIIMEKDGRVKYFQLPHPRANLRRMRLMNIGVMVFFRGEVIRNLELNIEYDHLADYEICLRAATNGYNFKHIRSLLYSVRYHPDRKTEALDSEMNIESQKLKREFGSHEATKYRMQKKLLELQNHILQFTPIDYMFDIIANKKKYDTHIYVDSVHNLVFRQYRINMFIRNLCPV